MPSFASEVIFFVGSFPVTNTFINTIFVDLVLVSLIVLIHKKKISLIPGRLQNVAELIIGGFYNLTESIAGDRTSKIFPFFMTFFLFIVIANWSGLIPGFTTVGIVQDENHLIPIIRSTTTDLNTTLALALISVAATHIMSIRALGLKAYIGRFISLSPILLFVGALEIISEITKVISLSFRLFGNIYAGEVVLETVSNIFAFIFPLPFLLLEVIVGAVQGLVFAMLTMAFMVILTTPHHEEAKEVSL
ncbi:MAG: ATP synthase F0 subunit A [Candidatus Levybacteria bacterium RIFOXYA1_FULL_41_10]|nr:MAG: ATP synthase subunit a [Candidatus Levybacteria bacterium GW2011_GWB1_36_18]KKR17983.1 MAG: ATP synthase subunit a [Candidatus Levybacteria bacterium GW2011_GWA1_39_32]KKR51585.1 MAG: ATP synthase subunit a [Candidatus Levybacteria bacterium GW2011_GWC1_40_19]KKR73777.1 MAG: ATP synthase subunit a [Candidatus Levybacteria bacterium GW2011_GWC2_40_7]KKR95236.1 MAG: ATP synthase subunit a [Candidatus Levybacteria bacterium GW2011_GWA2_41_15]OGH20877.1 MAG: ATP synthase F0 subunit A [Cand